MANTSILAAFERMWQHVTNRLSGKIDRPSAAIGSSTKPVYISSDGSLTEGSLYAGGTKVQQNGAWVTQANIYAPITQATEANQIIYYDGANTAPQWGGLEVLYYVGGNHALSGSRYNYNPLVLNGTEIGSIYRPLPEGDVSNGKMSAYNSSTYSEEFVNVYKVGDNFSIGNYNPLYIYPFVVYKNSNNSTPIAYLSSDGYINAKGIKAYNGADYAELLEWIDQNEEMEDRRGLFVAFDEEDSKKIKIANSSDEVIGIISATPSVIGNCAEMEWSKKYLTDPFGIQITQEVEISEQMLEDGTVVEAHTEIQPILNPEYDPKIEYIPRAQRPEWAVVGFLGQLVVCDDGTCEVGKYCVCGEGGKATASEGRNGWRVLERIDESHIKVFFK